MSAVLAKFKVIAITEQPNFYQGQTPVDGMHGKGGHAGGKTLKQIKLTAVMGEPFGPATPQGTIEMTIVNTAASDHFAVGEEYFVTFKHDDGSGAS